MAMSKTAQIYDVLVVGGGAWLAHGPGPHAPQSVNAPTPVSQNELQQRFDEAVLAAKLFGARPYAEVVIGELSGIPQGFALFFHNFSTFEGRPGIYLEDLFVRTEARGIGAGHGGHGRLDPARGEGVDANLLWRKGDGQRFGEAGDVICWFVVVLGEEFAPHFTAFLFRVA